MKQLLNVVNMENLNLTEYLKSLPLFSGVDENRLSEAVSLSEVRDYGKGEQITSDTPSLFCVIHGLACVYRVEGGNTVLLNSIKSGGVFGAAQLFSNETVFSSVKAADRCECLIIPRDAVTELLCCDGRFTLNYISFLSDRIKFLNKKIAAFTAGDGVKTLAGYLLSLPDNDGAVKLPPNMSRLAQYLNISRPTLYRALASLSDDGIIKKDGAFVKIISYEKLKTI